MVWWAVTATFWVLPMPPSAVYLPTGSVNENATGVSIWACRAFKWNALEAMGFPLPSVIFTLYVMPLELGGNPGPMHGVAVPLKMPE